MGRRVDLASLADDPILEAPVPALENRVPHSPTTVVLHRVAPNPLNPRETLGDLTELAASLRTVGQLQPCTVVSRSAYLARYPEHESVIGPADFVAVTGGRRRAAAELAGLDTLDIALKDSVAESRETLAAAAVTENIERRNFDVVEEARAVRMLVDLCGSGTAAAEQLSRTKGWVSQRLALLELSPEMQALLRSGELPVREARRLARLAPADQLPTWRSEQAEAEAARFTAVNAASAKTGPPDPSEAQSRAAGSDQSADTKGSSRSISVAAAVRRLGETPAEIANSLRTNLNNVEVAELARLLVVDA